MLRNVARIIIHQEFTIVCSVFFRFSCRVGFRLVFCFYFSFIFYFISFAKENKTYNVTKLKKGVGRDTRTAERPFTAGPDKIKRVWNVKNDNNKKKRETNYIQQKIGRDSGRTLLHFKQTVFYPCRGRYTRSDILWCTWKACILLLAFSIARLSLPFLDLLKSYLSACKNLVIAFTNFPPTRLVLFFSKDEDWATFVMLN